MLPVFFGRSLHFLSFTPRLLNLMRERRQQIAYYPPAPCLYIRRHRHARLQILEPWIRIVGWVQRGAKRERNPSIRDTNVVGALSWMCIGRFDNEVFSL